MPADESTAEVSRLLEQWDTVNRSPLQLSAILVADSVLDMGSADGDAHLVAILARFLSCICICHSFVRQRYLSCQLIILRLIAPQIIRPSHPQGSIRHILNVLLTKYSSII